MTTGVLWHGPPLQSAEFCELASTAGGHLLSGTVLLPVDDRPGRITYRIELDGAWRTRAVRVAIGTVGAERQVCLGADGEGHWTADGAAAPHLDGCLDVDLGFSPSTNTLPVRRLRERLRAGEAHRVTVAWLRFPGLELVRGEQTYERLGERRWRYSSGTFTADLSVDAHGLVTTYGGVWSSVTHATVADPHR